MRKGADCLSKWVGESERQLRLLFDQVRLKHALCSVRGVMVIFCCQYFKGLSLFHVLSVPSTEMGLNSVFQCVFYGFEILRCVGKYKTNESTSHRNPLKKKCKQPPNKGFKRQEMVALDQGETDAG